MKTWQKVVTIVFLVIVAFIAYRVFTTPDKILIPTDTLHPVVTNTNPSITPCAPDCSKPD